MEPESIITILGIAGGIITIFSFFMNRDKGTRDSEKRITEIEVKVSIYKEDIDRVKKDLHLIDTKFGEKLDSMSAKFDEIYRELIKVKKHD